MPHALMLRATLAIVLAVALATALAATRAAADPSAREPVVGLPCEGCEAIFDGLPEQLPAAARLAPATEPGSPLRIVGTVRDPAGAPAAGVVVYAYHTDQRGLYPPDERYRGTAAETHGRLRGWVRTDAAGHYRFDTIRPASYPDTDLPAHVHLHVLEPGRCTYYVDDLLFDDDPLLTPAKRQALVQGRGGNGVVVPQRDADGVPVVRRDIQLGRNIPGYPEHPGGAPAAAGRPR